MKRALFILLSALLLCLLAVPALAENSNFVSSGGWYAYKDGYMYFVGKDWTSQNLNDGRETGYPDSVEFWRIADRPGAGFPARGADRRSGPGSRLFPGADGRRALVCARVAGRAP